MVRFKYRIRAWVISIIEFGWSVCVLAHILINFVYFLNYIKDPALNGIFITTLVTSVTSSILQIAASILLCFGSLGMEVATEDVPTLLNFIERWDMLTGWRICLLLPSAFFPPLTIIKTSELLLSVVDVFIVYDYLIELQDHIEGQMYLPQPYTNRMGRDRRIRDFFVRTVRIDEPVDPHGTNQTNIGVHGSRNIPPPPPYEPPPKYDDIFVQKPLSNPV